MIKFYNRLNRWQQWSLDITLLALIIIALQFWLKKDIRTGISPNIVATTLDGSSFNLHATQEKPLLLHFWATWCGVCAVEQPFIKSFAEDYTVVSVALSSGSDEEIRRYAQENDMQFPIISDPDGSISKQFGVFAVPSNLFINRKLEIQYTDRGLISPIGLRARYWMLD